MNVRSQHNLLRCTMAIDQLFELFAFHNHSTGQVVALISTGSARLYQCPSPKIYFRFSATGF